MNTREYNLVIQAGIEFLDDFTLMSAAQLHAWTGIPLTKIQELYGEAKRALDDFHAEKKEEIEEICEFRLAAHTNDIEAY